MHAVGLFRFFGLHVKTRARWRTESEIPGEALEQGRGLQYILE